MEYLAKAADKIREGEDVISVVTATLSWLDNQSKPDSVLFDRILCASAVFHLIDKDVQNGKIQADRKKQEWESWTRKVLEYLDPGTQDIPLTKRDVLFVCANPMEHIIEELDNQPLIRAAEEWKQISAAIRYHQMLEKMPLHHIFEASFEELTERLYLGGLEILHFSNHGDENGIILNKGEGMKEEISAIQLIDLFGLTKDRNHLRLIFLNSCSSANLAQTIHKKCDDLFIICHNRDVPADIVRSFASDYYRSLAQHFSQGESDKNYKSAFDFALNLHPRLKEVTLILEPKNQVG